MNEGYIVASLDDATERPATYWDGTAFVESIDLAFFYSDKVNARLVSGQAQALYPEKEIATVKAKQSIVIV